MSTPILLIATSNIPMEELDLDLFKLFEKYTFHNCDQIIYEKRMFYFFIQIFSICFLK